jgi:hypothetical protein
MVGMRLAVCILVLFFPGLAAAQTAPDWEAAKKAILADYAKQQPGDKVLEITGPEKRDAVILAVRYYGRVLIERADKTRERQGVWIEYRLVGDRWELQTVKVYESTALSDIQQPQKAQAQKLMAEAWAKANCEGFDIRNITLEGEPRFQLETVADRNAAKRWYVYQIQVEAMGNGKFRLSKDGVPYVNRTQNMLLWNPADRSWSVDPRHVKCTGFSEKK